MDEFVAFAEKLGSVGFPTLLVAILYGGYKGIWVWGSQLQKCDAAWAIQLQKSEAEALTWKKFTFQLAGIAETLGGIEKSNKQP